LGTLLTYCWCGRTTRHINAADVREGRTFSCGVGCHRGCPPYEKEKVKEPNTYLRRRAEKKTPHWNRPKDKALWTEAEDALLKKLFYEGMAFVRIAYLLNKHTETVRYRAVILGLKWKGLVRYDKNGEEFYTQPHIGGY
jgi:hypothetical protein